MAPALPTASSSNRLRQATGMMRPVLKLTTADGATISARFFPTPKATFTLLFSHGNAEDIGYDTPFLEAVRDAGFAVFAYDYQGYGTSQGQPSEPHVYQDCEAAYNYLINNRHILPGRIIAWGRSLGAAAAVDLAARHPLAGLIMESAFTSAFRVLTRFALLPFDKFPISHQDRQSPLSCAGHPWKERWHHQLLSWRDALCGGQPPQGLLLGGPSRSQRPRAGCRKPLLRDAAKVL